MEYIFKYYINNITANLKTFMMERFLNINYVVPENTLKAFNDFDYCIKNK